MLRLERIKRTYPPLLENMRNHYSQPKGFVGRNLCYGITYDGYYFGSIVGGSSTLHLPGRDDWLRDKGLEKNLNNIVNNIFFHIEGPYPVRNFAQRVLKEFHSRVSEDWKNQYGDEVVCFETLVELPRTGEVYRRFGYDEVGVTKGYTCKRVSGKSTDKWSGRRVWDCKQLRPKRVFMRGITNDI